MKCTVIIPNDVADYFLTDIQPLNTRDAWTRLETVAAAYPAHGLKVKIGNGSFRDRVEHNQLMRRDTHPTMEVGKRKGYNLITFNF